MARRCLTLTLDGVTYQLRLTLAGQRELSLKADGADALSCVMGAIDSPEDMAELLTQALSWPGNENPIHDGEELYDLLVDNGYAGNEAFTELVLNIAHNAGLLSAEEHAKLLGSTKRLLRRNMDRLTASLDGEDEPVTVLPAQQTGEADGEDPLEEYPTL